MSDSIFVRVRIILAMIMTLLVVAACGGGGSPSMSVASVSSGGSGFGSITGFGSLIVDGMRRDDSAATYMSEQNQGSAMSMVPTNAMLGQSVEFMYGANGNMMSALISPELVGGVTAVGPSGITVLGTSVTINNDAALGPATRFVGYASLASIKVGDRVEVHGSLKTDSAGTASVQATLIVQMPAATGVRLTGYVAQYSATAGSFLIGSSVIKVGSATITPAGTALANGELVTVWSNADPVGNTITASAIRVKVIASAPQNVTISGAISNFTSTANFQIRNLNVDASKATIAPTGTTLAAGKYVVVVGIYDPAANKLTATSVTVFTAAAPTIVELHGTVANFVSSASFTVRGVAVDAGAATFTGGTAAQLANGVFVEVQGTVTNNVVRATSVAIQALTPLTAPIGSMMDVSGMITAFNPTTGSYTMTMASGATITGTLGSTMFYMNGTAANMAVGQNVTITGMLNGSLMSATVMSFSQSTVAPGPNSIHMDGIVYNMTPTSFMLNGITIQMNGVTVQGGGMMAGRSMMSGSHVAVDMQLLGGQYMATSIVLQKN
jgi:hypothetical protein